jgi:hypothetical protein
MLSACTRNYEDVSFSECGELDAVDEIRAEYLRFEVNKISSIFSKVVSQNNYFCNICINICIF